MENPLFEKKKIINLLSNYKSHKKSIKLKNFLSIHSMSHQKIHLKKNFNMYQNNNNETNENNEFEFKFKQFKAIIIK